MASPVGVFVFLHSLDYIGNVVLQKIIEKGGEERKLAIIKKLAPHLPAIGIHKNGTWVAQKVIDTANTPAQIECIINAIEKYTPPLLLDQFGNYMVQCCLRFGPQRNQFIFDAMQSQCWEIAQGRFGARATRTCLESQYTTKRQQKHVALAVIRHSVNLCTNPNGVILITWLLDSSNLPGRYRVIAHRLAAHVVDFCTHKLAASTMFKLGKFHSLFK